MAAEAQTVDLASWLTAVWDEEERLAKAAFSSQWDPENGWGENGHTVTPHVGIIHEDVQRAHVVRWHPGAVLARIAADRKILELHVYTVDGSGWVDCTNCGEVGNETDGIKECLHRRLLVSPYKDREGFQEAWL